MKCLKQYKEMIKVTDDTIKEIVHGEINKLGWDVDLNHIDVSGVTIMNCDMFSFSKFNGDISGWDVSKVKNMEYIFHHSSFNGDISNWNVGNVMNMDCMFFNTPFNGDVSRWNVGNVTDMASMFVCSLFNGDISQWNVGNVTNMSHMFSCSVFNGDISGWNVQNVLHMTEMFDFSPLKGREPWWYVFSLLFGSTHLMWDSLDFRWIDIESKIIYGRKLTKILKRSYNTEWNGELPEIHNFTYN